MLADQVRDVLKQHTMFADAILGSLCTSLGISVEQLDAQRLALLAPKLAQNVAKFTNPGKGRAVEAELLALIDK